MGGKDENERLARLETAVESLDHAVNGNGQAGLVAQVSDLRSQIAEMMVGLRIVKWAGITIAAAAVGVSATGVAAGGVWIIRQMGPQPAQAAQKNIP